MNQQQQQQSPGVEQKLHDGDNQATVLVDIGTSGHYFDDQLKSPSLDFTGNTFDENCVLSEEMLRGVHDCTAALDLNIDIPADRGDLRSEPPREGVSPSGGATSEQPVQSSSPSLLAPNLARPFLYAFHAHLRFPVDLVWFRLSCDHGWIRSGSVNVRKQQQQQH